MQAIASQIKPKSAIPLKSLALPIEHGSWGFVFEPIAAGLLLAPSFAAIFITIFVVGAFLSRQPLKFVIADWQQDRRLPRTATARRLVLIFGGISAFGLIGSALLAPPTSFIPFVVVGPLVVYLILQDAARRTRNLLPEMLAAFALTSSLPVMTLAAGWSWPVSLALWIVMLARLVPSIIYVRNRLRLEKRKEFSKLLPLASHLLGVLFVGALAFAGLIPFLVVFVIAFLLGRAILGLSRFRQTARAKVIGIYEIIYGVVTVLSLAVGFYIGF